MGHTVGGGTDDRAGVVSGQQVRCSLHQQQSDNTPQHTHQVVQQQQHLEITIIRHFTKYKIIWYKHIKSIC